MASEMGKTCGQVQGGEVKRFLMATAVFNLLLVITALSSAIIAAFTKDAALLAGSVALTLVSVFPATMMLVLCSNFKEAE